MFIKLLNQMSEERKQIFLPVIIGLIGGGFVLGIPLIAKDYLWQHFWGEACQFNNTLCQNYIINSFADPSAFIIFFGSLMISAMIVHTYESTIKNIRNAFKAGALSGAFSAFTVLIFYLIFAKIVPLVYIRDSFIFNWFFTLFLLILTQALMTSILFNWQRLKSKTFDKLPNFPLLTRFLVKFMFVYLIVALLTISIPAFVIYFEIKNGNIGYSSNGSSARMDDDINIARLDSDSIVLTQKTQNNGIADYRNFGWKKYPYYRIFVNGKDVSNISIIQKQGLPDTIDPPGGFEYGFGSKAIFSGPDFRSNTTSPNRILIEEVFNEGSTYVFPDYKI